jgi:hypothetical protein
MFNETIQCGDQFSASSRFGYEGIAQGMHGTNKFGGLVNCEEDNPRGRGDLAYLVAAWMPFIPGILRSRRTTSGFNCRTCSMACVPFVASPQTSNLCHLRSGRMAARATR